MAQEVIASAVSTSTGIPMWVEILQALATPMIGLFGGLIAFRQWRTAHQRILLDLFDRRLRIYQAMVECGYVILHTSEREKSNQAFVRASRSVHEAVFLFDEQMNARLKSLLDNLRMLHRARRSSERPNVTEAERVVAYNEVDRLETLLETSLDGLQPLFVPFMQMPQRSPRTPRAWFNDRNQLRRSFADHHQR